MSIRTPRAKPAYDIIPGSELRNGDIVAVDAALWSVMVVEHDWIFGTVDLMCTWHPKDSRHRLGDRTQRLRFRLMGWMRLFTTNEGPN